MLFFANHSIEWIQRSCSRLWYSKNSTDYSSESNIKMLQYICFRSIVESSRYCCRWLYHNCIHDKEASNDGIFSRLFFRSWFSREWRMKASMHCSNIRLWTVEYSSPKTPFSQRSIKYLDSFNPVYRFSLSIVTANASQESYLYRLHAPPAPCALMCNIFTYLLWSWNGIVVQKNWFGSCCCRVHCTSLCGGQLIRHTSQC